jgi:hypothetical protein
VVDREANRSADDVRARMDFALRCAFAHGTGAIRTHIDSYGKQTAISWPVLAEVRFSLSTKREPGVLHARAAGIARQPTGAALEMLLRLPDSQARQTGRLLDRREAML